MRPLAISIRFPLPVSDTVWEILRTMENVRCSGRLPVFLAALALALFSIGKAAAAASDGWRTVQPEEVGIDSSPLVQMFDFIRERQIPVHSVQIVRHARLALDAYFYPFESGTRHDVASITKSITSLLVGLAVDKHFLPDVQQPLTRAFPARRPVKFDDRKTRITLEHLCA